VVRSAPYWDGYIIPRYRYRSEDDRVDPCGGSVVTVIRVGPQEQNVPLWLANSLGLGQIGLAGAAAGKCGDAVGLTVDVLPREAP
jgi:hypothetical protein